MTVDYITGDALEVCRTLPDASIDLACSSPPFLALRNYNDLDGQWGSEPTPADFLDNLLTLTHELGRVLTPTGSIAIELGDTYSGSGGAGGDYDRAGMRSGQPKALGSAHGERHKPGGRPPRGNRTVGWPLAKSLCGIPTLYTWSLAYGRNLLNPAHEFEPWRIRNLIVWARNNPPVGALGDKVRPATSYITVATRSNKRWFDLDAVRAPGAAFGRSEGERSGMGAKTAEADGSGAGWAWERTLTHNPAGAPPLDHWHDEYDGDHTWLINPNGSKLAHYAMWPAALADRLILSMCPAEVCRTCQEPRRRIVDATRTFGAHNPGSGRPETEASGGPMSNSYTSERETLGWSECEHGDYRPGVVLDCFAGSGTTLCVSEVHGRDSIGIDLDPANKDLLPRRMAEVKRALLGYKDENVAGQLSLIDG